MKNLAGQVAIISGGLGDIGEAIARELAGRGADVAMSGRRRAEAAGDFLSELRGMGVRARYEPVDVADPKQVERWVDSVASEWGKPPSLIIPNAATVTVSSVAAITPEEWQQEIAVNLHGAFYMAQAAGNRLVAAGMPGRIVFVGSWAGHAPHPAIPAYSVAKAGMRMLCQCMALEWAPHGILVNEVAPGYVDAGLSGKIFRENPGLREKAQARVPVRELITSEEVAVQVAHLCDPKNRHITGSVLVMDGGLSLVGPATGNEERA
jgi:NAD(P)-dependent dehydrogenase (short-subunit alcohol dehydrogenase family)